MNNTFFVIVLFLILPEKTLPVRVKRVIVFGSVLGRIEAISPFKNNFLRKSSYFAK